MGILKPHIDLFCKLKKENLSLFKNSLLSVSQNAVYATENEVKKIFISNNLEASLVSTTVNKRNKIPDWFNTKYDNNINAQYLFSLLGSKAIVTSDISRYENPDVIIDLNKSVRRKFHNKFDNIIDMGTLEHIFNIPIALNNYKKMLKKNGYIIIATTCSNLIDHGFYSFSPTIFFDFFDKNGFEIKNCFLREYSPFSYEFGSKLYKYETVGQEIPFISNKSVEVFVVAKKIYNKLKYISPIQGTYFNNYYWRNKNKKYKKNTKKRSKHYVILRNVFIKFISYLPFYFEKKLFMYIRGKNITRID